MFLLEADIPETFRNYVNEELEKEWMGKEIDRKWGKTVHGQYVCFITSKVWWYAVRVIIDEEYRHLPNTREYGVYRRLQGIVIKEQFLSQKATTNYTQQNLKKYVNGIFNLCAFRCRSVSMEVHQNPDMHLKPGDHIQRNLNGPFNYNHDGIYLGNGKVAHIGTEANDESFKKSSSGKCDAHARIVPFNQFVLSQNQEVRIVVHCLRRRSRIEICETARKLVSEKYGYGQYDFLLKNCQHFATLCVLGEELMTDKLII